MSTVVQEDTPLLRTRFYTCTLRPRKKNQTEKGRSSTSETSSGIVLPSSRDDTKIQPALPGLKAYLLLFTSDDESRWRSLGDSTQRLIIRPSIWSMVLLPFYDLVLFFCFKFFSLLLLPLCSVNSILIPTEIKVFFFGFIRNSNGEGYNVYLQTM